MTLENIQWIDWAMLAVVSISTLISLKRGFVKEALSLAVWVFAVILTLVFYQNMAVMLRPYIENHSVGTGIAIVLLLIICLVIGGLFNFITIRLVAMAGLTPSDRLLGMIFGFLRGIVIVVMLLMAGKNFFPLQKETWWQQSVFQPHVSRIESWSVKTAAVLRETFLPLIKSSVK